MSDHSDREEPYGELMERLSRGISTWNFNFGTPENLPELASPRAAEISSFSETLAPLSKSRIVLLFPVFAVIFLVLVAGAKGPLWQGQKAQFRGGPTGNLTQQEPPIRMVKFQPLVTNGTVEVPIPMVEEKKLISFEYEGEGGQIPLLAFQTSSGKIETAVGISWPCNSKSFHIEGTEIVCDLCFTRWNLETLRGVSGECIDYPLNKVTHTIQDGRLIIRKADIQGWKPPKMLG